MKIKLGLLFLFLTSHLVGLAQYQRVPTDNDELESSSSADTTENLVQKEKGVEPYFNPEAYVFSNKTATMPVATFIFTTPTFRCCPWLGLSGEVYVQRNTSWAEALLGPSFSRNGLQGGVMLGYETAFNDLRIAPWVVYESRNAKFYLNYYYEIQSKGNDSSMRGEIYQQLSRSTDKNAFKVSVGARLFEKNIGPEVNLKKNKMYLFFAPMYGWKDNKYGGILGLGAELD